jgi:putative flippase GtrA
VQILFAFLLTLPFTNRFGTVSRYERGTYAVTLLAAAVATAFLIAPVSYHRIVFREGRKPQLVRAASVLAALGLVCLLVAMLGAVYLVTDVVLGAPVAGAILAGLAAVYGFLWYVLPFLHRRP